MSYCIWFHSIFIRNRKKQFYHCNSLLHNLPNLLRLFIIFEPCGQEMQELCVISTLFIYVMRGLRNSQNDMQQLENYLVFILSVII